MSLNIPIILGSVRASRVGDRVGKYLLAACRHRGWNATLVDPAEFKLPLLDKMYKEYPAGSAPEPLERLAAIIKPADGYLVVTAEYNHSIPPALSNLMDHFLEEYFFKPSGIACYSVGAFGGVRAAMQLRAMLPEMGTPSIPSLLPFPKVQEQLDADGKPQNDKVDRQTAKFLNEFEWYARAMRAARAQGTPY